VFEGEKTVPFWAGLVIFGFSLYFFVTAIWQIIYYSFFYQTYINPNSFRLTFLQSTVPMIIGGIIFMSIGLYMMKLGAKKNTPTQQPSLNPS
jgi:hypothetical protein